MEGGEIKQKERWVACNYSEGISSSEYLSCPLLQRASEEYRNLQERVTSVS